MRCSKESECQLSGPEAEMRKCGSTLELKNRQESAAARGKRRKLAVGEEMI